MLLKHIGYKGSPIQIWDAESLLLLSHKTRPFARRSTSREKRWQVTQQSNRKVQVLIFKWIWFPHTITRIPKEVTKVRRETMNRERGTENGERGTGNGKKKTLNQELGTIVWERVHSGYPRHNFKIADDRERKRSGKRSLSQTAWTVDKVPWRILPPGYYFIKLVLHYFFHGSAVLTKCLLKDVRCLQKFITERHFELPILPRNQLPKALDVDCQQKIVCKTEEQENDLCGGEDHWKPTFTHMFQWSFTSKVPTCPNIVSRLACNTCHWKNNLIK